MVRERFQDGKIFLLSSSCRLALIPTGCPMQWVKEVLSLGVKQPGRVANIDLAGNAELKNDGAISPPLTMPSRRVA
jgi:hypothetical protein